MDIYIYGPFLFGIAIALIIWGARRTSGDMLQRKFVSINPLKGKSYDQIIQTVGLPNSYVLNKKIWSRGGYSITLLFDDDDVCIGVISEFKF